MSSRRAFLRSSLAVALGGTPMLSAGCAPDRPRQGPTTVLPLMSRPILRPWADDMVWLFVPAMTLPAAYVSVARREVFVDSAYRDRASWLLRAHISVSTALWRIPLAGDPPRRPIQPGDETREFEERPISAWDPSTPPGIDDIRVVLGRAALRRVDFSCTPLTGARSRGAGRAWLSGGPFTLVVSDDATDSTVREDFGVIGVGSRHRERACSEPGETVQYVSWARRQFDGASR